MKTDDIQQKINNFGHDIADNDFVILVSPKDGDRLYSCLNGDGADLVLMFFEVLRKMTKDLNMPFDVLCHIMADTAKDGDQNEG